MSCEFLYDQAYLQVCMFIYTVLVASNGIYTDFSLVYTNYTLLEVLVMQTLRQCYYTHSIGCLCGVHPITTFGSVNDDQVSAYTVGPLKYILAQ